MSLKHAILVSLAERPGSGYTLTRRFDKSLGFFWHATHQQIYRTLKQLLREGQVSVEPAPAVGKPDSKIYRMTDAGGAELHAWSRQPTAIDAPKSELAVKLRGIDYMDAAAVLREVRAARMQHQERLDYYLHDAAVSFPEGAPTGALGTYLVLRGGITTEQAYVRWCDEIIAALEPDQEN